MDGSLLSSATCSVAQPELDQEADIRLVERSGGVAT
jgi:hypothetical protein